MSDDLDREGLAVLVHEVRSPVAAIAAISDAVTYERLDPDSVRELLRLAVDACRGIERIVGEATPGSLRLEVADVAALAVDAARAAALGGASVRVEVGAEPILVAVDAVRLRQALDNLIANAVAHGGGEDEIVVRAESSGETIRLSVTDHGPGIDADDQSRILEPGVRLDERRPGSGLGLAIVRTIVEAHAGTLGLESAPGQGATFTIALSRERP